MTRTAISPRLAISTLEKGKRAASARGSAAELTVACALLRAMRRPLWSGWGTGVFSGGASRPIVAQSVRCAIAGCPTQFPYCPPQVTLAGLHANLADETSRVRPVL